ncbi:MAG: ATP-binding cassette domain-containing protein [Erysipelotrichaceae bacterium]|jgi:oligopeptide transport system ATP-binding protein|nr:ATP-binding cassette domain-containing protein [Erysipelotrichaceae bacterium]
MSKVINHYNRLNYGTVKDESLINKILDAEYEKDLKKDPQYVKSKVQGQLKNPDDAIVKFRDVRISFKMGPVERIVVDHLNLDIKRGEILGLVGESGSGKTTIGRAINRINDVTKGVIAYNNVPISGKIEHAIEREIKTKVQMVFQDPSASLNERANVDYIISEGLRAFHLYHDEQDRLNKVMAMIEQVGLRPEHLKRFPHEFSGGQRQRIGIARCMIMNPEFVIADEPISALDVSIRAQVLNLIKDFKERHNMTVLFIAHDLSVVKYISDRIAVIFAGKIVELAPAQEMFDYPLHPYTIALLSAIPIPDPKIESKKKIQVYNPQMHQYTKDDLPELVEIRPGHFVRANKKELAEYQKVLGGKK